MHSSANAGPPAPGTWTGAATSRTRRAFPIGRSRPPPPCPEKAHDAEYRHAGGPERPNQVTVADPFEDRGHERQADVSAVPLDASGATCEVHVQALGGQLQYIDVAGQTVERNHFLGVQLDGSVLKLGETETSANDGAAVQDQGAGRPGNVNVVDHR